ncbi:dicarboxylate/amino acid:cation symporter [Shewanella surugensis]|uniref:Dicarboxylate/amino acid:cation symporter n=1 Tax=Shewanella surugensis TaxID=212020 RepID=A0ABT0LF83_9GAMM|nr:dicarboxylate/amino acid:cation symporter [Shewanella surugensis]MCL1126219.1 dicarboxylate/amino acid:cation symporter [Shewanella surugensis]
MLKKLTFTLPGQLVIAALLAALLGYLVPTPWLNTHSGILEFIGLGKLIYIGLLKMLVGIVVLFSLLQGITHIGSIVSLKSLGSKTVAIYALTTVLAISLGLAAALLMPSWPALMFTPDPSNVQLISQDAATGGSISTKLLSMALTNPFSALANGNLLAIVLFAIMFGIALLISLPAKHAVFQVIEAINTGLNRLISGIIKFAPIAVFSIIFEYTSQGNASLFGELASFALLVFVLTLIHGGVTLPLLAKIFTGRKLIPMFKAISAPMAMAFATSSSAATLPLSMRVAEEELGVSQSTSSMVLPLGSIMNMDGTALFEGVAAIFLAQLYGIDLGTSGLVVIFLMAMVSSIGAPGMPSGSMSGMQLVLLAAGIPLEAIAILLIIERPLDTFRTAVNVEGDLIASVIVDKWQQVKS